MKESLIRVTAFLHEIGMPVAIRQHAPKKTFLRDVWHDRGVLCYTPNALAGDVLHEAGHLAVTPSFLRKYLRPGDIDENHEFQKVSNACFEKFRSNPEGPEIRAIIQSGETEAIAWSYAAAVAAGINPMLPFLHGFDGAGDEVCLALEANSYLGINGLRAGGMIESVKSFPSMTRWMQR